MAKKSETTDPVKIHEYMLKRSVEIPTICMAVLLDLTLLLILFMIRDSKKAGAHGVLQMFLRYVALPIQPPNPPKLVCHC